MNTEKVISRDNDYILHTYGRSQIVLAEGEGMTARDADGKSYLDFTSGIGVNSLGYCHPAWVRAVADQAARLQHTSNLYYTAPDGKLAKKLCRRTGLDAVFFGNSGAEANEGAIKCARKYSVDTYGESRNKVITLVNSFHGRTLATLTATGQDVFHHDFGPFPGNFDYVPAGDFAALEKAADRPTEVCDMKLSRKLAALAMAVLLAVSLTACSPKQVAQDMVVHLVHKLGLVEESDEDDTDTTTKAPAGGSVEFPAEMDTTAARVVTYPVENTLYVSFNGIANRSTEYFVAGGDSMTVTGYATTEASNEKYMYFKIAFWELSDDKTMTSYVPDSTIYYCADGANYQYNVTGLTAGKQYKITISYDNGNKYYVTGGLKVEGLGSTELNTYGDDTTTG